VSGGLQAAVEAAASRLEEAAIKYGAPDEMAECGECAKGCCDHCDMCDYLENPPWRATQETT
jgi:hypothetical protein